MKLIETILWRRRGGYWLLEQHLERLIASANELDFKVNDAQVIAGLEQVANDAVKISVKSSCDRLMVRLLLAPNGTITITSKKIVKPTKRWLVAISPHRSSPDDQLLRHKTTRRQLYDNERQRVNNEMAADEVIFLNTRNQVCEGAITSIFSKTPGGELLTPPLDCGLLAGVFRGHMLKIGCAREQILNLKDIMPPNQLLVANSVRGLIPANLITRDQVSLKLI